MIRDRSLAARLWATAVWAVVILFAANLLGVIATVLLDSLATRWLGNWLPAGFTTHGYGDAWDESSSPTCSSSPSRPWRP